MTRYKTGGGARPSLGRRADKPAGRQRATPARQGKRSHQGPGLTSWHFGVAVGFRIRVSYALLEYLGEHMRLGLKRSACLSAFASLQLWPPRTSAICTELATSVPRTQPYPRTQAGQTHTPNRRTETDAQMDRLLQPLPPGVLESVWLAFAEGRAGLQTTPGDQE